MEPEERDERGDEKVFRSVMVKGDSSGHRAHIPVYIISGLVGLVFGGLLYYLNWSAMEHGLMISVIILASLVVIQIPILIIALRLIAKEVFLYADRLVLEMRLGQRVIPINDIEDVKAIEPDEAKRYFYRLSALNLTMGTQNAVMIIRKKGVPYIINPEKRDEFLESFNRVFSEYSEKA